MTSTSLHDWNAIVPQRADGYARFGDAIVGSRRRYQFGVVSHYGVQSTVNDLAKYDAALSRGHAGAGVDADGDVDTGEARRRAAD